MTLLIDCAFIEHWHPLYEKTETDQPKYEMILRDVERDLKEHGTLAKTTFLRIIDWKAARVKGALTDDYSQYERNIAVAHQTTDPIERILTLTALDGIGVPVASTILHFMDPDAIPINDYRTVEVLHYAGLLLHLSRDAKRFPAFMQTILKIRENCPSFTLRQIDRALFAYHKQYFEPEIKSIRSSKKSCRGRVRER